MVLAPHGKAVSWEETHGEPINEWANEVVEYPVNWYEENIQGSERRIHLGGGGRYFLDKVTQEDTSLRVTFRLRPESEETAVPSCRNVFQAEDTRQVLSPLLLWFRDYLSFQGLGEGV